jgi:transposase-like protein
MTESDFLRYLIIGITIAVLAAMWHYFGNKCPACRRTHALEYTGQERKEKRFRKDEEFKCKYCGHRAWKTTSDFDDFE